MTLRFTVLGPVAATVAGAPVDVARPRRRAVLAYLLLNANRVVSVDQLTAAIWGNTPPATARAQIQSEISALRWTFQRTGDAILPLLTKPGGYLLDLAANELDLANYTELADSARAERDRGRLPNARALLRDALALWGGPALAGAVAAFVAPARERLEETRLADLECLIDIELRLGLHRDLISPLTQYVAEYPFRERLRGQLMVALYRSDRQPEALGVARRGRQLLVDEHGLDPGPLLRELEHAVLRQDPSLDIIGVPDSGHPTAGGSDPGAPTAGGSDPGVPTADQPAAVRVDDLPRPAQLPPAPALFAGRHAELANLTGRLGSDSDRPVDAGPRVVLLHGRPGVGKSALALQVARAVAAAYPDGQLYADLAGSGQPRDPDRILDGFLRALGVAAAAIPVEPAERAALLRSLFAGRRCLLLLDDAADASQVLPLLPAGAGCAVLATTRWQLDLPGAYRHLVAPVSRAQGLEILAGHLGPDRLAAEPVAVRALATLCEGLPLALWFAARRMHRGRWAADLVALLRDPRHRLDELGSGDGSMRDALAPSFRRLSAAASLALRRIAVLPTATIPDWAPAVCAGLAPREAMRALDELVGADLLTPVPRRSFGPHRYVLSDLVRAYALTAAEDEPGYDVVPAAEDEPGHGVVPATADEPGHGVVPATEDEPGYGAVPAHQALARAVHGWSVLAREAAHRLAPSRARRGAARQPVPRGCSRSLFSPAELDRLLAAPGDWLREERANLATVVAVANERGWTRPAAMIVSAVARAARPAHPDDRPSTARYARTLSEVARKSNSG